MPEGERQREGSPTIADRIVGLRRVPARELEAHPLNWRRHPDRQREILEELLRQIGYADALLAYRDHGALVLVDGHLRQSLNPEQIVPVLELDLTPEEAELLLATLDPLAGLARADPARVAELHADVEASSEAVRAFLAQIASAAGVPPLLGRTDPDQIPPLPEEPRTRPGDLWVLGPHRVVCADARDPEAFIRLLAADQIDAVWTDPPFGVAYVGKTKDALRIANDRPEDVRDLLAGSSRTSTTSCVRAAGST